MCQIKLLNDRSYKNTNAEMTEITFSQGKHNDEL